MADASKVHGFFQVELPNTRLYNRSAWTVAEQQKTSSVNGFMIPPGSASSMARAVTEILLNEERARRFGEAARSKVETRFSLGRMLEDYRAILLPASHPGHILGAQHFSSGPAPAPHL